MNNEYSEIIDEISQKFGYDEDLTKTLKRVTSAMIDGKSDYEKQTFYKMLGHTPIVVLPYDTKVTEEELNEKYLGNINPHIKDEEVDEGAYGEAIPDGAFVTEAILDENLNLKGNKQYLFIKRLANFTTRGKEICDMFGTDINVQHLIHELGHAQNAEIDQYKMDGNTLSLRVGTSVRKSVLTKVDEGKYLRKEISRKGLMLEEAINTNEEQEAMCRYLGVDKEEVSQLYKNFMLVPSNYQGLMSDMTEHLRNKVNPEALRMWRLTGDNKYIEKISKAMEQTDLYKERNGDTERMREKRQIFSTPTDEKMKSFFEKYDKDFFPDKTNMTPMDLLDNCLLQCFDIKTHSFKAFNPSSKEAMDKYRDSIQAVLREGYVLINQATRVMENDKVSIKSLTKNALEKNITEEEVKAVHVDKNEPNKNEQNIDDQDIQ